MKLEDYDLKVLDLERAFIWKTSVEEDEYSEFRDADVAGRGAGFALTPLPRLSGLHHRLLGTS